MPLKSAETVVALLQLAHLDKTDWEGALGQVLRTASRVLGIERTSFWSFDRDAMHARCELGYLAAGGTYERGMRIDAQRNPRYFDELRKAEVIAAKDAVTDPRTADLGSYLSERHIASLLDVPIWVRGEPVGILCHEHLHEPREFTPAEIEFALHLAQVVSTTLEARARDHAERRARWAQFLDEASLTFSSSLEPRELASRAAALAIPTLADWVIAYLDEKGELERVAMAHKDREGEAVLRDLMRHHPQRRSTLKNLGREVMSGSSVLIPQLSTELLQSFAMEDAYIESLKRLKTESLIAVPLSIRGRAFGFMIFASTHRRYTPDDLPSAEELTHRLSLALDNAVLYQQAQVALRQRDEFLSLASHELRTPLTALHLSASRLAQDRNKLSPTVIEEVANTMTRAALRLAALVDELLDASVIHSGRLTLHRDYADLGGIIRQVVETYRPLIERAGCPVNLDVAANVTGYWDAHRISRAVASLLDNAIKFGRGKPIDVSVKDGGGAALLSITDRGGGIASGVGDELFAPFARAGHAGGLGLGLYIVHETVLAHGGTIRFENEPDEGVRFTVELPRDSGSVTHAAEQPQAPLS